MAVVQCAASEDFFQRCYRPLRRLMRKGDRPNFKQLIFEKKFRKSKKKIQSLILVTFNAPSYRFEYVQ